MRKKSTKLKIYRTGLIASSKSEPEQPDPPFKGAGWYATLPPRHQKRVHRVREVLIHAASWHTAQGALNLTVGSLYLFEGDPPLFGSGFNLLAYNESEPEFDDSHVRNLHTGKSLSTGDIAVACAIAAKASTRRKWVYGITKYNFSINLYSQSCSDLEPFSSAHLSISPFPDDHVIFCHAIVSAYSVLEDMGLELRASKQRPSRINGEWNPLVKKDLEDRLVSTGIDLDEPILWTVRGPVRKTEKKRTIPSIEKTSWARGMVRDCDVEIVDAIAYADWLRDCIASHNVKELTRVLSPYAVINVQHLARRLLLESLGFWRYYSVQKRILAKLST